MKRAALFVVALLMTLAAGRVSAFALEPQTALVLTANDGVPPLDADPRWRPVTLPDVQTTPEGIAVWYRIELDLAGTHAGGAAWMLYLPYLYGGGRAWLNRIPIGTVQEGDAGRRVRWERPHLLPLQPSALRDGRNVLHIRSVRAAGSSSTSLSRLVIGTQDELQAQFDRRMFFVRTVPQVTVAVGIVVGLYVLFIWWRRPGEVQYGLFGIAALLWALRTNTFVLDTLPASAWWAWRLLYHATTGGFMVALALFAVGMAGWRSRAITVLLVGYALLGPLVYLLAGNDADVIVGRFWAAGLIPVGASVVVASLAAAWRRPQATTMSIAFAVALAFTAGVHDYLVAWHSPWLAALLPEWVGHRVFLLHYAADLLLAVMGATLTLRFVQSLGEVEVMNRTLEDRVRQREAQIAASYEQIAALQRREAAADERQRIMQDLHDGMGSQLLRSLSQAERGALDRDAMAASLRRLLEEMRLAIEALAADEPDLRTAFGDFWFRWEPALRDAGIAPAFTIELPEPEPPLAPHDTLQLLRIAQEALANVLKHAGARAVEVTLRQQERSLVLEIVDDGRGLTPGEAGSNGRGLGNMRSRARRLGATLELIDRGSAASVEPGTASTAGSRVRVTLPLPPPGG